jgi:mannose-6-phosphate isomerase-like protein (cupin superfamily)
VTLAIEDAETAATLLAGGADGMPTPFRPGAELVLAPGALVDIPSGTSYRLVNAAAGDAVAVAATLVPPVDEEMETARIDPAYPPPLATPDDAGVVMLQGGVTVRPLVDMTTLFLPDGPARVGLGRVVLAAGAALAPEPVAGPVLLAVDGGGLALTSDSGRTWVRRGATGHGTETATAALGAGDGVSIPPGTAWGLRNPGPDPLTLLIFAITPSASDPSAG